VVVRMGVVGVAPDNSMQSPRTAVHPNKCSINIGYPVRQIRHGTWVLELLMVWI
jgi:hypothetical protein